MVTAAALDKKTTVKNFTIYIMPLQFVPEDPLSFTVALILERDQFQAYIKLNMLASTISIVSAPVLQISINDAAMSRFP